VADDARVHKRLDCSTFSRTHPGLDLKARKWSGAGCSSRRLPDDHQTPKAPSFAASATDETRSRCFRSSSMLLLEAVARPRLEMHGTRVSKLIRTIPRYCKWVYTICRVQTPGFSLLEIARFSCDLFAEEKILHKMCADRLIQIELLYLRAPSPGHGILPAGVCRTTDSARWRHLQVNDSMTRLQSNEETMTCNNNQRYRGWSLSVGGDGCVTRHARAHAQLTVNREWWSATLSRFEYPFKLWDRINTPTVYMKRISFII